MEMAMTTAIWRQHSGRTYARVRGANFERAWAEFLGEVPWDWFVTLTFDPRRVFPVGCDRAGSEARRWSELAGWTYRKPVAWLVAPERCKSGQWHAHVLLAGVSRDLSPLASIWEARNGKTHVQRARPGVGALLYATKEAGALGEVLLSDTLSRYRRLTASNELGASHG